MKQTTLTSFFGPAKAEEVQSTAQWSSVRPSPLLSLLLLMLLRR
jgi:hypothetical protein